jgi:transposase
LPVRLALTAGEAHDNRLAAKLLSRLKAGSMLLADRGYDADWIRALAARKGALANIPPRCNRSEPICFSPYLYRARNLVERFFNKIKHCRRVATRYDKLAANYLAFVQLASIRLWRALMSPRPRPSASAAGLSRPTGLCWGAHLLSQFLRNSCFARLSVGALPLVTMPVSGRTYTTIDQLHRSSGGVLREPSSMIRPTVRPSSRMAQSRRRAKAVDASFVGRSSRGISAPC